MGVGSGVGSGETLGDDVGIGISEGTGLGETLGVGTRLGTGVGAGVALGVGVGRCQSRRVSGSLDGAGCGEAVSAMCARGTTKPCLAGQCQAAATPHRTISPPRKTITRFIGSSL